MGIFYNTDHLNERSARMSRFVKLALLAAGLVIIFALLLLLRESPNIKLPYGEQQGNRILIISPHPDDESIAAAGVVKRALTNGHEVKVVLLTYGDGFLKAAQKFTGKKDLTPDDYLRLGRARKQETARAMSYLGLSAGNIIFLGYPDSALEILWDSQWDSDNIMPAGKAQVNSVPYNDALKPGAPYSGESVADSLANIISDYQPTEIYYPDSSDDHPDHWAASAFVRYTLTSLNYDCNEFTYLVHRSLWPQPDLEEPTKPLSPPEELLNIDTRWVDFALTKKEIELKKLALHQYVTQEAVMEPFLWAFIRSTELFGQNPALVINESGTILKDPRSDTIGRLLEGPADITGVNFARLGSELIINIETRDTVSNKITYLLGLRIFDENRHSKRADFQVDTGELKTALKSAGSIQPEIKSFQITGNRISLIIADPALTQPVKLMAGAQTLDKGALLDKTAWRTFSFTN
jgi:LmbE family N-acetylglucosaminyl deacetylase